jgi:DNA modification methylase
MLTKTFIEERKLASDTQFFIKNLVLTNNEQTLRFVLENLGRLPSDFDQGAFLNLLKHPHPNIRLLAVKNLGKLKNSALLDTISKFAEGEANTTTRREAVSTIGRMRTPESIPILIRFLKDDDPKVILQAIRGLINFKILPKVQSALTALANHPNELIQDAISRELTSKTKPTQEKTLTHPHSLDALKNVIVHADVRDVLSVMADESIHLTFTSPPYYNARDYTIYESYATYLQFLFDIFREVHRITKEGRFFVLNTSPVIIPRMSRAHASKRYAIPFDIHPMLTEIGWEFIDDIIWVKPERCVKNRNGGFFQHRKPLGYKANSVSEYVMVYRKKTDNLIDWNMRQYDEETVEASLVKENYEKTNVWHIHPASDRVHPAIFPTDLATQIIQFYSFKGDIVFDPFAGIGTVGVAALMLERFFLLAEQEEKYVHKAMQTVDDPLLNYPRPKCFNLAEFEALLNKEKE